MAKGRFLKSAERACAGKARFDSALEAERTADWRFGSYRCPVCHKYHLTSASRAATSEPIPEPTKPKEPGPKLADLDWSRALNPQPKAPRPAKAPKPARPKPPPAREARCLGPADKGGRAPMLLEGRVVKSAPIKDQRMLTRIASGTIVFVSEDVPAKVLWVEDRA